MYVIHREVTLPKLMLAILRRFLPLGIVFSPKTTATSCQDAAFFPGMMHIYSFIQVVLYFFPNRLILPKWIITDDRDYGTLCNSRFYQMLGVTQRCVFRSRAQLDDLQFSGVGGRERYLPLPHMKETIDLPLTITSDSLPLWLNPRPPPPLLQPIVMIYDFRLDFCSIFPRLGQCMWLQTRHKLSWLPIHDLCRT